MTYTDLNYLRTVTEGNEEIIREMIEMFVLQVPDFIKNFNKYYQAEQYTALGKEAHKAKSSLQIMGMTALEKEMRTLQFKSIEGIDVESYPVHLDHFKNQCNGAIIELEAELAKF